MRDALLRAFRMMADEGLNPESVTLTPSQFRALLSEQSMAHAFLPAPPPRPGMAYVEFYVPWGIVRVRCGSES